MYQIERSITGSTSQVVTETGLIKSGEGVLRGIITNATSSGTIVLTDALEASTVAVGTITQSVGAGGKAIHGGSTLTSTGASAAATHPSGTLTVTGAVNFLDAVKGSGYITASVGQPTAGDTIVLGNETYTIIAAGTSGSRFDVPLGATYAITTLNLFTAMSGNPLVDVVHTSTYVITVTAKTAGTAGNIVATESATNLAWNDGSTLTGGLEAETVTIGTKVYRAKTKVEQANDFKIAATSALSLVNLKAAINATASAIGVTVGDGTVAHTQVVAYTSDATTLVIKGREPGATYNTVATTETTANSAWGGTTLVDGVATTSSTTTLGANVYTQVDVLSETYGATAIPYQFLRGASEATMLDALKAAINADATQVGTLFSTGTVAHPYMIATTNADDSQVVVARTVGDAAFTAIINALPTTDTHTNLAWTSTTINGGVTAVATTAATITINGRVYTAVTALSESTGATAVVDQILWTSDEATFLDNLKKAINGSGVAGTDYSTGTTPNVDVFATTNAATTQVIQARLSGVAGNAITTTAAMTNYAWGATTLASGAGATSKVILNTYTPAAGSQIDFNNIEFERGLYATVGGTSISATISYK